MEILYILHNKHTPAMKERYIGGKIIAKAEEHKWSTEKDVRYVEKYFAILTRI